MGRIKGWTKTIDTGNYIINNRKLINYIVYKNNNVVIKIKKTAQSEVFEYIRTFYDMTVAYKTFKTKQQAKDYAVKYMKAHPRG